MSFDHWREVEPLATPALLLGLYPLTSPTPACPGLRDRKARVCSTSKGPLS